MNIHHPLYKEQTLSSVSFYKFLLIKVGEELYIEKLEVGPEAEVVFDKVLMLDEKVGAPYVEGAKVTAVVENTFKDDKVIVFKYKSKKDYHRTIGHRQQYTNIRIKDIKLAKAKEAAPAENAEA